MRIKNLIAAGLCAVFPLLAAAAPGNPPQVLVLTDAFAASADATAGQAPEARVTDFKERVAARFPAFYGIERHAGGRTQEDQDRRIARALENFPKIRAGYERKGLEFASMLDKQLARFQDRFPDYQPTHEIVVLHSLGEMDGGVRSFDGRHYLVFGMDILGRRTGNEAAFFDHELFHTYHHPVLRDCDGGMWLPLWSEGLAVHAALTLNPGASEQELLLDIPAGMAVRTRAQLGAALADLERNLDSEDPTYFGELFTTDDGPSALPWRRGYYLGFLVAQQAAKRHGLQQLAKLDCKAARAAIGTALRELRQATPTPTITSP